MNSLTKRSYALSVARSVVIAAALVVAVALSGTPAGDSASAAGGKALRIAWIGQVAWSPRRSEIAFDAVLGDSSHRLLITAPDGSGTRSIEARVGKDAVGRPVWSPNGERIALSGWDGRTPFVAVASRLGTPAPLAVGFGDTTPGSWSPDSTRLALNGVDPTDEPEGVKVVSASPSPFSYAIWSGYGPSWSPRRDRIAYIWGAKKEVFGPEPGRDFVYTADSQGEHRRRVLRGSNPSWSSDGKLLAYTAARGVYVMNADGSRRRLVYRSRAVAKGGIHLAWAPQRRLIAVPFGGTVVVDVGRHRVWRLRLPTGVSGEASWSPDGRRLVFAAGSRLYIVGADGEGGRYVSPA
jgi:Tol biopolymer transport system component